MGSTTADTEQADEATPPPEPAPVVTPGGPDTGTGTGTRTQALWQRPVVLVLGLAIVAGGIPLAVALGVLAEPDWYPVSDYAQAELRVRDITDGHAPLIGAAGRVEGLGIQGSHPGPITFYLLFPVYALLGSQPWGLLVATAVANLAALATAVGIAHRRGGRVAALGMASALALLLRAYGEDKLVEPWNPYMALLWWVVFLMAVWSVLCDDWPLLPLAVFAGVLCVQAHFSYLGLVLGIGALAGGALVVAIWRARRSGARGPELRWMVPAAVLGAVLWIPPLVDQLRSDPGNLAVLRESLRNPPFPNLGFGSEAVELWLTHLDLRTLFSHTVHSIHAAPGDGAGAGLAVLTGWSVAVALAVRLRNAHPQLWRLHLVVGLALGLQLVSISRINGPLYDYVLLWAWGTTTLLLVVTVWTFWAFGGFWQRSAQMFELGAARTVGAVGLAVVLVVTASAFTYDASHAQMPMQVAARFSAVLSPQVVEALRQDDAPGAGAEGRYLLHWDADAFDLDWSAYGLLLELQRAGFDVGVEERVATPAGRHRVRDPGEATAVIEYVLWPEIEAWRDLPDAVEVASYDPRSPAEGDEYERLADELVDLLQEAQLDDLVPFVEGKLLLVSQDERVPAGVHPRIARMYELGLPVAVFVAPVGLQPPSAP